MRSIWSYVLWELSGRKIEECQIEKMSQKEANQEVLDTLKDYPKDVVDLALHQTSGHINVTESEMYYDGHFYHISQEVDNTVHKLTIHQNEALSLIAQIAAAAGLDKGQMMLAHNISELRQRKDFFEKGNSGSIELFYEEGINVPAIKMTSFTREYILIKKNELEALVSIEMFLGNEPDELEDYDFEGSDTLKEEVIYVYSKKLKRK
jgi:hypothetical protein